MAGFSNWGLINDAIDRAVANRDKTISDLEEGDLIACVEEAGGSKSLSLVIREVFIEYDKKGPGCKVLRLHNGYYEDGLICTGIDYTPGNYLSRQFFGNIQGINPTEFESFEVSSDTLVFDLLNKGKILLKPSSKMPLNISDFTDDFKKRAKENCEKRGLALPGEIKVTDDVVEFIRRLDSAEKIFSGYNTCPETGNIFRARFLYQRRDTLLALYGYQGLYERKDPIKKIISQKTQL